MFEVPMPDNIKKYKGTVIMGLSFRKLLVVMIIFIGVFFIFKYLNPYIGQDGSFFIIVLFTLIVGPFGWATPYGMAAEKYISLVWRYMSRPSKRCLENRNLLDEALEIKYHELENQYKNIGKGKDENMRYKKGKKKW